MISLGKMRWSIYLFKLFCLVLILCSQLASSLSLPSSSFSSSALLCSQDQSFALLQFKQQFPHPKMESWEEGIDCCSWAGVTCDRMGSDVIGLDLSDSGLQGTIPSNSSLFHLSHLQWLNLSFNNFSPSPISSGFGKFGKLKYLNLSRSQFSGQVPLELSYLSKLTSLDLSGNSEVSIGKSVMDRLVQNLTKLRELHLDKVKMSNVLPSSLMNLSSSLTSLTLFGCGLQGRLPDNIFRLPNLRVLTLNSNSKLIGVFPTANWSSPLTVLDICHMHFLGELPKSIGNLRYLTHLGLVNCNFNGPIPASLGNLTQLTVLDLSFNNFHDEIPSSLSNLKALSFLNLKSNNLRGKLPPSLSSLKALSYMDFQSNNLSGTIPVSFGGLTKVMYFCFSSNNFTGQIPSSLSKLEDLTYLNLANNNFVGTFPNFVMNLTKLTHVDLNSNHLTGQIGEFQHTNSLEILSLYNNRLYGSIPKSISNLVSLNTLDISSNNLSGMVEFDMFSKLNQLGFLDLSYNNLSLSITNNLKYTFPTLQYLNLASCNLTKFPDFLRMSKVLQTLDLSNNRIYGQIPDWMFEMEDLRFLNLSHNSLSSIESLPRKNLVYLNLHANMLQGRLLVPPPSIGVFLISNNYLIGEIPSSICNLSSLQVLDLSRNNLSGMIPQCLGNLSDSLSVVDFRKNNFHGTIPKKFAKCNSLRTLVFNGNQLEGLLPQSLVNCTKLEVLDLGNNKLNDSFPYWLEALPKLQVLVLRSNRFSGRIGGFKTNSSFPMLRIIDLSHNEFIGVLPTKFFEDLKAIKTAKESEVKPKYMGEENYQDSIVVAWKGNDLKLERILTIFTTMDLSSNKFYGQIPQVIGMLKFLRELNLSHNSLTSHIPSSLANLSVLESLDLSSNMLNGSIPKQLTSLTFLAVLNLSQNQLIGPVPQGSQFNTFRNDSYIGNIGLCGFPLSKKCKTDEPPPPPSIFKEDNDSMFTSGFGWKAVLMGCGFGFMFGSTMGYLMLKIGKPELLIRLIEGEWHGKVRRPNNQGTRPRRNECI